MIRRLFTLASILSLLFCIATAALWVRSYSVCDYLLWYRQPRIVEAISNAGLLGVGCGWLASVYTPRTGWEGSFWPFRRDAAEFEADLRPGTVLGFRYEHWRQQTPDVQGDARALTLPFWSVFLLFAGLPAPAAWRWRRHRTRRHLAASGRCPQCGYDLRASTGRCPECGTVPTDRPQRAGAGR